MIVTIIGNIGSGKSTAMPVIAGHLDAVAIDADNLFQTSDPFAQRYLEDTERWAFANELWLTYERAKILETISDKSGTFVVDSGLLISWVYTHSHYLKGTISNDEWELYQRLYSQLATSSLKQTYVIYLACTTETLLKRIKKRGREYELKFYTPQYLEQLHQGLEALVKKLEAEHVTVIRIEEDQITHVKKNTLDRQKLLAAIKPVLK